jgi:hypothetical protein
MEIIKTTDDSFNSKILNLETPQPTQGGAFFTKFSIGEQSKPFYVQFPKCLTKQGIVTTKRGKYCDLLYERSEQHESFIKWVEGLETICKDKINEKKELWFSGDYTKDDIDYMMAPVTRIYKSGKYVLIRVFLNINKHTTETKCLAYNENEVNIDLSTIDTETYIIPLLLIDGIKFSSKNFELDIKLTQIMVLDKPLNVNSVCLIKKNAQSSSSSTSSSSPSPLLNNTKKEIEIEMVYNSKDINSKDIQKNPSTNNTIHDYLEENEVAEKEEIEKEEIEKEIAEKEVAEKEVAEKEEVKEEVKEVIVGKKGKENLDSEIEEIIIDFTVLDDKNKNGNDLIILKKPNEVYYTIYKKARAKAKLIKHQAIRAKLEANEIKNKYMLDNIEESSSSDDDEI